MPKGERKKKPNIFLDSDMQGKEIAERRNIWAAYLLLHFNGLQPMSTDMSESEAAMPATATYCE